MFIMMHDVVGWKGTSEMLQVLGMCVGGLLVILPKDNAADFCADILEQENRPAWIIGSVTAGTRTARIAEDVMIVEVPES